MKDKSLIMRTIEQQTGIAVKQREDELIYCLNAYLDMYCNA